MDPLELYRWAVQDPETHAELLLAMHHRSGAASPPAILREDFAGTSADSAAWLALERPGTPRQAIAIDIDGPTLAWGYRRARRLLGRRADALRFIQQDVLTSPRIPVPRADIIAALNFSALYMHETDHLRAYLAMARDALREDGILVMNLFGGPASVAPGSQRHRVTPHPRLTTEAPVPPFDYIWEVREWDPDRRRVDCRIHFDVPTPAGGTRRLADAFRYDFRVWTPLELINACRAAGFKDAALWRHTFDPARGADAVSLGPVDPSEVDGLDVWTAYVVARR